MYTIKPLLIGTFYDFPKSRFMSTEAGNELIDAPCFSWLIEGDGVIGLVDSGPKSVAQGASHNIKMRQEENSLLNELKKHGVSPEDVQWIIVTHLHWDHCTNLELFPNARLIVQRKEIEVAVAPLPDHRGPYEITDSVPEWINSLPRMEVIDGDLEFAPGLQLLLLPGHSRGIMGINVDTHAGKYLVASDVFPLYANFEKRIAPGVMYDEEQWYKSYATAKKVADFILPGHDLKILEKSVYGC